MTRHDGTRADLTTPLIALATATTVQIAYLLVLSWQMASGHLEPKQLQQFQTTLLVGPLIFVACAAFIYFSALRRICSATQINDLTAQLADAQQRERLIADYSPDAVFMLSAAGDVLSANASCFHHFEFTPAELQGERLSCIVQRDQPRLEAALAQARTSREPITSDLAVRTKSTVVRDFRLTVEWSESSQCYFCCASDVSAEKQLERIKQEYVSTIGHDLRTPLMSLEVAVDLFASGKYGELSAAAQAKIKGVHNNVRRLVRLTSDLLFLEQSELGTPECVLRPTPVQTMLAAASQAMADSAADKNVQIDVSKTASMIVADEDKITRVLVNLLSNAIKFAPPSSTITVRSEQVDGSIEIRVTDSGPGIAPQFHEAIFERYKQVRPEDARNQGGSGLGLAICKAFVDAHHGAIGVVSQPGQGTTFWIRLPAS